MGKETKTPATSLLQLWDEFKALRLELKEVKSTVIKLKDLLLTKDNWHSKIVQWIGKEVFFSVNPASNINGAGNVGKLLWADRYHIGVAVADLADQRIVREHLINKGHIVFIREV